MAESSTHPKPTPTIPSGGAFSPGAQIKINAPPEAVFEAIRKTADYPEWNSWVYSISIDHQPDEEQHGTLLAEGVKMTLHVQMSPGFKTISKELVNICDEPPKPTDPPGTVTRVNWKLQNNILVPAMMLHTERMNEVERLEDGTTLHRSYVTFGGPYARLVKWKLSGTLQARFEDSVKDLKTYVEKDRMVIEHVLDEAS